MSKLGDKIRRASRVEAQPLGFVTSRATQAATMVLVALEASARDAAQLAQRGADVVVLGKPGSPARPDDAKDLKEMIAGAWIGAGSDARACREAGFDFVAFDPDSTPSTAVLDDEIGYVMVLPRDASDVEVRTIESFQLDALDVGKIDGALSVRSQLDLRRISGMTRKPLLATVRAEISVEELRALRDAGVVAVAAQGADAIARLRATIDALPPRSRKREEADRPIAVVPRSSQAEGDEEEDDEE